MEQPPLPPNDSSKQSTTRVRRSFFDRWSRKTSRFFSLNGFQLQRLSFFIAVPIATYWLFSDAERVDKIYNIFKPFSTQPDQKLESLPRDIREKHRSGKSVDTILKEHAQEMQAKKEQQQRQLEELRQQQERYRELSAKQSTSTSSS